MELLSFLKTYSLRATMEKKLLGAFTTRNEPHTNALIRMTRMTTERSLQGFTLIEMLVVLGIMAILTTVVLSGQSDFNQSLLLSDTAYTIGLSVREAQNLGLSSRKFGTTQNAGYGVHFSMAQPDRYTIFSDILPAAPGNGLGGACPGHTVGSGPEARPGNCLYDSTSEVVQTYTFTRGFAFSNVCGNLVSGNTAFCSNSYPGGSFDIVFMRPNTQTVMLISYNGVFYPVSKLILHLAAPTGGAERCIVVSQLGQVSVNQTCT